MTVILSFLSTFWTTLLILLPFALLLSVAAYLLAAIPTYKIATNAGYDKAWIAWIPGAQTLVLMDLKHGESITILPDWTLEDRFTTGLIFCVAKSYAIPMLGLGTIGNALAGHVDYIVFSEVLDRYIDDKEGNRSKSLIICIIDCFTGGLVRSIYLLTLMNKAPLAQPVCAED